MSETERSFVMVKPDGVQRGLIGEVISRIERRGLKIAALKMIHVTPELARKQYADHAEKPFFKALAAFVTSGPVVAMVVEGPAANRLVRNIVGALDPEEAAPGSIRGDFTVSKRYNVIHGSDSPENAKREIGLFFSGDEIFSYETASEKWLTVTE
ncbi:MAG: nucleoside-diphosphate kinase [bacterium]